MRQKYYKVLIKGAYEHIEDIGEQYINSFWELMDLVNYNFEISDDKYIEIIETLGNSESATVGDYDITIIDNIDNLLLEALNDIEEMEEGEEK